MNMKTNPQQITIHTKNCEQGLNIYICIGGIEHYVTTHRKSGLIWNKLKDGITLGELKRIKPKYPRAEQKFFHSAQHIIRVVDDFLKYDLAI